MRLDKFLKTSLIFKTRSSAEKAIDDGKVLINNKIAKPATNISINDILEITFPLKKIKYQIVEIKEKNVSRKEANEMYKIIGEEKFEL